MFEKIRNSLALRAAVFFCLWLGVVFFVMTVTNVFYQNQILLDRERSNAKKTTQLILTAMANPMLNGDQDVIQKQFYGYKNLERLSIAYLTDNKGIIRRCTDEDLIGRSALSLYLKKALAGKEYYGLEDLKFFKKTVYSEIRPIRNGRACYPCHGKSDEILGVVRVAIDWTPVSKALALSRTRNIIFSLIGLIVTIFLTVFFVYRRIVRPAQRLELGLKKAGEGDFESDIPVEKNDEIGDLTMLFNKMAGDLKRLMDAEQEKTEELTTMNSSLQGEITERRRVELAIQDTNRRLTDIINFLPDATLVIDQKGKVIAWNRAMESMTGIKSGEMIGKGEFAYGIPFYGHPRPILIDVAVNPKILPEGAYSYINKEKDMLIGESFSPNINQGRGGYLWGKATLLYDIKGEVAGAIETVRDITERKNAEEKLEKAYNELKQVQSQLIQTAKMASIGTLAGGVAHEINNPLTGVLNNVQLIKMLAKEKENFSMDDFSELLNVIEESAHRCIKITRSLLDFSHASKGEFKSVAVNGLVEEVLSLVEHDMSLENIKLEKSFAHDLPMVMGDQQLLQQAFLDIISNARWAIRKKSGRPGGTVTITTGYNRQEKGVEIVISDSGVGIPKENLEKIFEPFFTTKEVGEGTGLGMSITYSIIKVHRGNIKVKSEEQQGATFSILLPVS